MKTDYFRKNERRRAPDKEARSRRLRARAARKRYGVGGAFGWLRDGHPDLHHLCATGTKTAPTKEEQG